MKSGNESIVRYNRGFTVTLRVLGWFLILGAAIFLWGVIFEGISWSGPLYLGGLSVFTACYLFVTVRPFSRSFVAVGPEGIRLGLMKFHPGDPVSMVQRYAIWTLLPEQRLKWEEIGNITYDSDKGVCRFRARNYNYELTDNNSPSPRTVAKLMAERKGVQLLDQEALVPPAERPMPRRKQAKIMVGIGVPTLGAFAAGVWWANSQAGEISSAAVGILTTLALVGISLIISAIILVVQERVHSL